MKASAAKHNTGLSAGGAARLWALVLLLLAVFFGSFFLGRYGISPLQLLAMLAEGLQRALTAVVNRAGRPFGFSVERLFAVPVIWTPVMETIVLNIRLPRILMACLVGCFGSRWLARLFTPDADLVRLTALVARIYFAGIWAFGMQMACQCCFMGMGQAKISLFLALLRKVILLVPLAILLPRLTGSVFGIYAAEPIADILASCTAITLFLRKRDQLLPAE